MPALRVREMKDKSVKGALREALSDDRRISVKEAYAIVRSALDKNGISRQERRDLRLLFSESRTVDRSVSRHILAWLDRCDRLATRLQYSAVKRHYGGIPSGWVGSMILVVRADAL